jgi:hypothetical protein
LQLLPKFLEKREKKASTIIGANEDYILQIENIWEVIVIKNADEIFAASGLICFVWSKNTHYILPYEKQYRFLYSQHSKHLFNILKYKPVVIHS